MHKYILALLLMIGWVSSDAQSIAFYEDNFDQVLEIAKREGKDIFLDTYAPWCGPCKKMDIVFRDRELASFYNDHFINIKINVDREKGKNIAARYGIAFLPTMLIMDANGNVKQRIDGMKNSEELLQIGAFALNPTPAPQRTEVASSKIEREDAEKEASTESEVVTTSDIKAEPGEKILFVLDGNDLESNPEYLYHESYYRIQKMDGSHTELAEKYLKTQEDWSTEKNMRFIHNFIYNVNTDMFDYYVAERASFEQLFGAEEYRKNVEIVINKNLYRQIPRPDFDRVKYLYGLLYPRKFEKYAYQYMLKRYEDEEAFDKYVILGEKYIENQIQKSPQVLYKLGKYKCNSTEKKVLKECVYRVEESIKLSDEPRAEQYFTLAQLYLKINKKKKAKEYAEMAVRNLSNEDPAEKEAIQKFLAEVQSL